MGPHITKQRYFPAVGTLAFKTLEYLRTRPDDWVTSTEIYLALGVARPNGGLEAQIRPIVANGLALKKSTPRRALSTYKAAPWTEDGCYSPLDDVDDDIPKQQVVDASSAKPLTKRGPASVFELGQWI